MSDHDMLRRGDVLAEVLAYLRSAPAHDEELLLWDMEQLIRALPAAQPPAQCCMCGKAGLDTTEHGGPEAQLSDKRWACSPECYYRAVDMKTAALPAVQPDAAGLSAGGGAGQMADTPMITGLVASNLTAGAKPTAVQLAHVKETPKSQHDIANVLTPAAKGGGACPT